MIPMKSMGVDVAARMKPAFQCLVENLMPLPDEFVPVRRNLQA